MWWHNWRHLTHLKDEALSPMAYKVETIPIASSNQNSTKVAANYVQKLIAHTRTTSASSSAILDWLRHEFGIVKPGRALAGLGALNSDGFISAVRDALPKAHKLSAAKIAELKREHSKMIEPIRKAQTEIFTIERNLSDLINAAYGLTSDEVQLMWKTAPPRMPFTPVGLTSKETMDNGDED
jgi:hypothetical protein